MNPEDGYVAFFVNPKSGASSAKRMVHQFRDYLNSKGFDVRVSFTKSLSHATQLAASAAFDYHCSMIVVAGGDGTVRETAHGMEGSDKPLMIIPCGTENLLANELGFNVKVETIIKALEKGCIRSLDLGIANGKCFTSVAGIGFDGDVVKRVSDARYGHINYFNYFWPIWRTFWEHKFPTIKVTVDGEDIFDGAGMAFVGNISRYAIGLQILRNADFGDGLLDICIYKCNSKSHLIKHSIMTVLKRHVNGKDVIYRQGKSVDITSSSPSVQTEADGDPGPNLPVRVKIIPQAVKVFVPPNAKPAGMRTRIMRIIG